MSTSQRYQNTEHWAWEAGTKWAQMHCRCQGVCICVQEKKQDYYLAGFQPTFTSLWEGFFLLSIDSYYYKKMA